jgi:hypothetical protein
MTCITGLVHNGTVYIGGDSAGVGGWSLTVRADSKVFRNGDFLFGFTSSFRMGDILRYSFSPPHRHSDEDIDRYMRTTFIDAVRACLRDKGYARNSSGEETGGQFLVGYAGRLFNVDVDFQVGEALDGFEAVGCGGDIAKGALFATLSSPPRERILLALQASERFNSGVRGPFVVESL